MDGTALSGPGGYMVNEPLTPLKQRPLKLISNNTLPPAQDCAAGQRMWQKLSWGRDISITRLSGEPVGSRVLLATDAPRVWWKVAWCADWSVIVATNSDQVDPVARDGGAGVVFLGAEQAVFALRVDNGELLSSVTDTSDVRAFQPIEHGLILALAADQILAFHVNGSLCWRQSLPDLVDDVVEEDGRLLVTDVSGERYHLDYARGEPLAASQPQT